MSNPLLSQKARFEQICPSCRCARLPPPPRPLPPLPPSLLPPPPAEAEAGADAPIPTGRCAAPGSEPTDLVDDHATGDLVCTECGTVMESHVIDEAPEWRSFDDPVRSVTPLPSPPPSSPLPPLSPSQPCPLAAAADTARSRASPRGRTRTGGTRSEPGGRTITCWPTGGWERRSGWPPGRAQW